MNVQSIIGKKGFAMFFVVTLILFAFSGSSHANEVLSEGSASLLKISDPVDAKEKAIESAKSEALLKTVSLFVNKEILLNNREYILGLFKTKRDDVIKDVRIVSEEHTDDGYVKIKINAKVLDDMVRKVLISNLYDDRVIVLTSEKNLGKELKRHILEHELIAKIKGKGYSIVDYRTIKDNKVNSLVSSVKKGDTESVKKIGLYFLTDTVVVGFVESRFREQTKDIYSARANGQVKVHQIGKKKEISSVTRHEEKGFGDSKESAGIDSIKKVSEKLTEDTMKHIKPKPINKVKITIKELNSHASYVKAREILKNIPYVNELKGETIKFNLQESAFYIETTKGIDHIVKKIEEMGHFVIKKIGVSEIVLEARRLV